MDHEPGADAPGPDPESAAPEPPPRVPPSVAPPSEWPPIPPPPSPRRTSEPSAPTSLEPTELSEPTPPDRADVRRVADPARDAGRERAHRAAAAFVGVELRGSPTDRGLGGDRSRSGAHATPKRNGGMRSALVGGLAGALVGALIAGGLVVAFDDDPEPQPVRTQSEATDGSARPANVIVRPGDIRSILDAARPAVVRIDVGGPTVSKARAPASSSTRAA